MENKHYIIIGILILAIICGSIYYYTSREEESIEQIKEIKDKNNSGIVLGDADSQTQTNIGGSSSTNSTTITSGEVYLAKITELRTPINTAFDDLNAKMKYKTLFTDEDAQKAIDDLVKLINDSLETVKNLPIDAKFKTINEKEMESLTLLSEAMDAFQKLYVSTDQEEKTKLNDIYSYKIDQSNNILKNVAIPK